MGFVNDLKEWEAFEEHVRRFLSERLCEEIVKNEVSTDTDLLSESGLRIEVKTDRRMRETWNIFIEYAYKNNPSGILKDESLDYLAYWDYDGFYLFDANKLADFVIENLEKQTEWVRLVNWGDWWNSKGMLLSKIVANSLANVYYDTTGFAGSENIEDVNTQRSE